MKKDAWNDEMKEWMRKKNKQDNIKITAAKVYTVLYNANCEKKDN